MQDGKQSKHSDAIEMEGKQVYALMIGISGCLNVFMMDEAFAVCLGCLDILYPVEVGFS